MNPSGRLIGLLFAIGSACFFLGPFPGFADLVGDAAVGVVFFVGSIFFTSAGFLQYAGACHDDPPPPGGRFAAFGFDRSALDPWAALIQFIGTLCFNVSTFEAMSTGLSTSEQNRLVWAPDAFGSTFFLVSGAIAFVAVRRQHREDPERTPEELMALINFVGCILFGVSAIASFIVPDTGSMIDLAASNWTTSAGAFCFFVGAVMLARITVAERRKVRSPGPASS